MEQTSLQWETVLNVLAEAIWLLDKDLRILWCNAAFSSLVGVPREAVLGDYCWRLVHKTDQPPPECPAAKAGLSRRRETQDWQIGGRWFQVSADPMLDSQGGVQGFVHVLADVTERKRAEEALRQLSNRHQAILSALPDIIMEVDAKKVYTWANSAGYAFFGDDLVGKEAAHYFEGEQDTYALVQPMFDGDPGLYYVESWQRRRDGQRRLLAWWCRALKDAEGRVTGTLSTARDITELREAETELRDSQQRLRLAVLCGNVGLWDWDLQTNKVWFSPEWKRQIGYEDHEISNDFSEWQTRVHPDDLERSLRTVRAFIERPWPDYHLEFRFRHKDGSYRWILTQASLFHDESGKAIRMVGSHIDITERRRTEAALRASEERFRTSAEALLDPLGIYSAVRDAAGRIADFRVEYVNPAACAANRMTREQQVGRRLLELLPGHRESGLFDEYCQLVQTGKPLVKESLFYEDVYGQERLARAFDVRAARLGDGFIATWRDVTERKRAEEALWRQARRLQVLHELGAAILAAESPEAVAKVTVSRVRELVPCQRASVVVFDPAQEWAVVIAAETARETNIGARVRFSACEFALPILQQGQVRAVDDLLAVPALSPALQALRAEGIRSFINVPLLVRGALIGVLNLGSDRPRAFTAEDKEVAREVADTMAVALMQAQLAQRLRTSNEHLRALSRRLMEGEETGRRALARELHDRVGQSLGALSINLEILKGLLPPESLPRAGQRLEDSLALAIETMDGIRDVMAELRPPVLDDLGLAAALRWAADRFAKRTGVQPQVRADEPAARLPAETETALFRIAQEALTNVAKHAQARNVSVSLETTTDSVRLTVADDGLGFDPAAARPGGVGVWAGWGQAPTRAHFRPCPSVFVHSRSSQVLASQ